jgi:hypothetical protein
MKCVVSKIVSIKGNVCFTCVEAPDMIIFLNPVGSTEVSTINTMGSM